MKLQLLLHAKMEVVILPGVLHLLQRQEFLGAEAAVRRRLSCCWQVELCTFNSQLRQFELSKGSFGGPCAIRK